MELEFLPKPDITEFGSYDPDVTSLPAPGNFIPSQIATAYNIPTSTGAGVKIGILSLGGGFLQSDINKSMADLGITAPTINFKSVNGATNNFDPNDGASTENTLDIFCIAGMVPNATINIYIGTPLSASTYSEFANRWANIYNAAIADGCDVITQSWSVNENYGGLGDFLSVPIANAVAQGISVFNSTGDAGSKQKFTNVEGVNYPSSNANVIAVGGTILNVNQYNARINPEVAAAPSGGGISSIINIPSQQIGKKYQTYNSSTGITGPVTALPRRGIPDIAAPYQSYAFYLNGAVVSGIAGTSAATPIMAGMMARFISKNGGRRPPPNSLAKIFYSNYSSFYDIIYGNNAYEIPDGYAATAGWDPVTGLGSQANGVQTYQAVTTAGLRVKTASNTWSPVQSIKIKTSANTWTTVNKVWTKTVDGWKQVF